MPIDIVRGTPPGPTIVSTAGLLARGSLPVTAFPGWTQSLCGSGSPLTVAGAAAAWELAFRTAFPVRSSRGRDRRCDAIEGPQAGLSLRGHGEAAPLRRSCLPAATSPRISH